MSESKTYPKVKQLRAICEYCMYPFNLLCQHFHPSNAWGCQTLRQLGTFYSTTYSPFYILGNLLYLFTDSFDVRDQDVYYLITQKRLKRFE